MIVVACVIVREPRHDAGIKCNRCPTLDNRADALPNGTIPRITKKPYGAGVHRLGLVTDIDIVSEIDATRGSLRRSNYKHRGERKRQGDQCYSPTSRYATSAGNKGIRCFCAQPRYSIPPPPVPTVGS